MKEHHFYCPHCHAGNTVLIDNKSKSKEIIADCDVCGSPVQLKYEFDPKQQLRFEANFATQELALA